MTTFLRRFARFVRGVLSGFDRVVFKDHLPQLYSPEGMNCYAAANHVHYLDFKKHAREVTGRVLAASRVEAAKADGRFQYLGSGKASRPVAYNWTTHQSEWATDVAFTSRAELEAWYPRPTRYAFEQFDSAQVLRFLGRSGRLSAGSAIEVHSDVQAFEEAVRLKHWVNGNSVKMYDHGNVLRVETTINEPKEFRSYRAAVGDPEGEASWRVLRRSVADMHCRAEVRQAANARYLESLAGVTATVADLTSRWTEQAAEPGKGGRRVRGLNPLSAEDGALLTGVSDPRWSLNGVRNRDQTSALFGTRRATWRSDDGVRRKQDD